MTKHPTAVIVDARDAAANRDARPLAEAGGRQESASAGLERHRPECFLR